MFLLSFTLINLQKGGDIMFLHGLVDEMFDVIIGMCVYICLFKNYLFIIINIVKKGRKQNIVRK